VRLLFDFAMENSWFGWTSIASVYQRRNIHAGRTRLNSRQFAFFLRLDIAVGIARQCNCYSVAASGGVPRAIRPWVPPTVRRPFGWPATAWKLLDGE